MTLWHLFQALTFTIPFSVFLSVGIKTGTTLGVVTAIIISLPWCLLSFYASYGADYRIRQFYEKARSDAVAKLVDWRFIFGAI